MPKATVTDKRTRIPDDFEVSSRMIELARQHKWPDPMAECEVFRDYHLAHGTLMLDWEAAFRTWMRNAAKFRDERANRVYTRDPLPVRRLSDRPPPIQFTQPETMERLDEEKLAKGRQTLVETINKLTGKMGL